MKHTAGKQVPKRLSHATTPEHVRLYGQGESGAASLPEVRPAAVTQASLVSLTLPGATFLSCVGRYFASTTNSHGFGANVCLVTAKDSCFLSFGLGASLTLLSANLRERNRRNVRPERLERVEMPSWLPSIPYPPARDDGYWAPITSTLDWCEEV